MPKRVELFDPSPQDIAHARMLLKEVGLTDDQVSKLSKEELFPKEFRRTKDILRKRRARDDEKARKAALESSSCDAQEDESVGDNPSESPNAQHDAEDSLETVGSDPCTLSSAPQSVGEADRATEGSENDESPRETGRVQAPVPVQSDGAPGSAGESRDGEAAAPTAGSRRIKNPDLDARVRRFLAEEYDEDPKARESCKSMFNHFQQTQQDIDITGERFGYATKRIKLPKTNSRVRMIVGYRKKRRIETPSSGLPTREDTGAPAASPASRRRSRAQTRIDTEAVVVAFLADTCDCEDGAELSSSDLYNRLEEWCEPKGIHITTQEFSNTMESLGFEKKKASNQYFGGLTLKGPQMSTSS